MNGFSEWKSGSALHSAFNSASTPSQKVTNYRSLDEMLHGVLGDRYGNAPESTETTKNDLQEAQKRVKELSDATEKLTELANAVEKKIEETLSEEQPTERVFEEVEPSSKAYRVFRDKDENFECKISIQGAGLAGTRVRLVLETDLWNFVFNGRVGKDGRCIIPLKKSIPLPEGTRGRAYLEVIVDEQLFIAWEDDFVVEGSKKVKVELKEQKSVKVSFENTSDEDR